MTEAFAVSVAAAINRKIPYCSVEGSVKTGLFAYLPSLHHPMTLQYAFPLVVSTPMAAHALRELESMLRHVLEVPMEAKASESSADTARRDAARKQRRTAKFPSTLVRGGGE